MVNKVACFLTCGYTESGAMQFFLKKINNSFDYIQYLPNKSIKKRGTSKIINNNINGLTGEALLEKVYSIITKHKNEIESCVAIIIEDDLDGRFSKFGVEEVKKYKDTVVNKLHDKLGKKIPVFILYASPEIESWFIADWENGFKYLYHKSSVVKGIKDDNVKKYFCHNLKKYINKKILKQYKNNIEEYGYFGGKYCKLSDMITDAIQCGVKGYIKKQHNSNTQKSKIIKQICESSELYYSKKLHGDIMLRNIKPEIIERKCRKYFASTYHEIADFSK